MDCKGCEYFNECRWQCLSIPEGKKCADCAYIEKCIPYGRKAEDTVCRFKPVRFTEKSDKPMNPDMRREDIVYFELNNWMPDSNYPNAEPFTTWLGDDLNLAFDDEKFVRENRLCVVRSIIDMSVNYCITAKKEWVEKNCPELLTKYTEFLRFPEEDSGCVYGWDEFFEYSEANIGITYSHDI